MSRFRPPTNVLVPSVALATLVAASCSTGGYDYWLYPEPRLAKPEEAVFSAHENHRVLSIDGKDLSSRCTGEWMRPQAYHRSDITCLFHIRPGRHSVVFQASVTNRERMSLDFTAEAGQVYGLIWTGCGAYLDMDGHRKTCRVEVEEIKESGESRKSGTVGVPLPVKQPSPYYRFDRNLSTPRT